MRSASVGRVLQGGGHCADSARRRDEAEFKASTVGRPQPDAEPDMQPLRTFIVEDSSIILDNLVATLEEMAPVLVVGSAPDEATAMTRLAQLRNGVDLIIIDVFLKSGSGLGVLRGATQAGLPAKCVVLTNYATVDMRDKCKALGADRVFDKSNDLDDLLAYCVRLAEGHDDAGPGAFS